MRSRSKGQSKHDHFVEKVHTTILKDLKGLIASFYTFPELGYRLVAIYIEIF